MLEQQAGGSSSSSEAAELAGECATLVELLEARQAALAATLDGAFPELRATVWQSEASVQAAVQVRCRGCAWLTCRVHHAEDTCACSAPAVRCMLRTLQRGSSADSFMCAASLTLSVSVCSPITTHCRR